MTQEIETLVEMGFDRQKAEKALAVTNNKGVQPAMEWLLAHAEEPDGPDGPSDSQDPTPSDSEASESAIAQAKSLRCDECGKLFKSTEEVEYHAAKSGHSSFSESTEEKKPLTEEEKREQLAKLEERMKAKRKEREEKEKSEALDREKLRIKSGKDMQDAKQRMQEQEMKKIIEQRQRDKLEDQKARDRVRKQIESDKEARRLAAGNKNGEPSSSQSVAPPAPAPVAAVASTPPIGSYDKTRLQMRLPNGKNLVQTFGSKEQLAAVVLYIQMNAQELAEPGQFGLMTTFPKRIYNKEDYDKPLDILGLVPSAVIIVTKNPII